jgi:tetratricopeptide (TPR) repeat protein
VLADQPVRGFSVGVATLADDLGADPCALGWAGSAADLARAARLRQELALARAHEEAFDEACQLAEGVVRIYRRLAQVQPTRFAPELGTTLTACGLWSSRLGRHERAVSALTEAVEVHRDQLACATRLRPMRRLRLKLGLAVALTNLGSAHSERGDHTAAAEAGRAAVGELHALHARSRLYRLLSRQDPLSFEHCLASSLNNLGVILADAGEHDQAYHLAEKTVARYRVLAAQAPVTFESVLARTLHNFGLAAAQLGHTDEALSATREAVYLHRSLFDDGPEHQHQLGRALAAFARVRVSAGTELVEALETAEEAVRIHERLAILCPEAYTSDLHSAYRAASSARAALPAPPPRGPLDDSL